jgi:hypothetical protein
MCQVRQTMAATGRVLQAVAEEKQAGGSHQGAGHEHQWPPPLPDHQEHGATERRRQLTAA